MFYLLVSRDLAPSRKPTVSHSPSNPRGNTIPQVRKAGTSRAEAGLPRWAWRRSQLRGAGSRRGEGRGSRDLLIAGVTGLTGPWVLGRVRMLRSQGRALGGGDQPPLLQFPVSLGTVAAVRVSGGCRREAELGQREVAVWEWKAGISLPGPHAPRARRVELKVSLRSQPCGWRSSDLRPPRAWPGHSHSSPRACLSPGNPATSSRPGPQGTHTLRWAVQAPEVAQPSRPFWSRLAEMPQARLEARARREEVLYWLGPGCYCCRVWGRRRGRSWSPAGVMNITLTWLLPLPVQATLPRLSTQVFT